MTELDRTPDYLEQPISGGEAAAMIQNALELPAAAAATEEFQNTPERILADYGIVLPDAPLTREMAALALYRTAQLSREAPGMVAIPGK